MEQEVARFRITSEDRDQNHKRFLAEAAQFLRNAEDSLDVLRFLHRLLFSPFASRSQPQEALRDIGNWLGARLEQDPWLDPKKLAYELGWMQRLVAIRRARLKAMSVRQPQQQPPGHSPRRERHGFESAIERIDRERSSRAVGAPSRVRAGGMKASRAEAPAAPTELPGVFEAEFSDVNAARDARKKARERERAGKPKKGAWLSLKPVDGGLAGLSKGLCCMLDTKGCEAVFELMAKRAGVPCTFWVTEIKAEEGRLVAGRITLERPE